MIRHPSLTSSGGHQSGTRHDRPTTLARAYRPGEVTLHLGGRAIPPATVGRLLGMTDET